MRSLYPGWQQWELLSASYIQLRLDGNFVDFYQRFFMVVDRDVSSMEFHTWLTMLQFAFEDRFQRVSFATLEV